MNAEGMKYFHENVTEFLLPDEQKVVISKLKELEENFKRSSQLSEEEI